MSFTQKIRANIIVDCYKRRLLEGKKVLDVGCGNGTVSKVIQESFKLSLTGVDTTSYCKENIHFVEMAEPERFPFEDHSFDYVMFNDVLHHCDNIKALLIEARRVADKVFIFEDKGSFFMKTLDVSLNYFYLKDMKCPMNFCTKPEWCDLFESLGFHCEVIDVKYPLLYPLRHMAFELTKK